MKRITISVKSLKEKLLEMERDDLNLVELHIVSSQTEEGTLYPSFLHVAGISQDGEYSDYESIDETSMEEYLTVHKSA